MDKKGVMYKVALGGWYQRTTLHLSEVYDFLMHGVSQVDLSKERLREYHKSLGLEDVKREAEYLEFVRARTKDGIEVRFYEDGLYMVEFSSDDVLDGKNRLDEYLEKVFNPAIAYIFSKGAPTPKVLANIKVVHPVVVTVDSDSGKDFVVDEKKFGEIYSSVTSGGITVIKTRQYIFIIGKKLLDEVVGMQIFFREFKDQLARYLAIHRSIWEEISEIKERKHIKGKEVEVLRAKLDGYQKTVSLISNRINQMGSYVRTRSSISKSLHLEDTLVTFFQYKFEVLMDTLDYIKEIWKMTLDYVNNAIAVMNEVMGKATLTSIHSLRTVTIIGVVASIMTYLAKDTLPAVTVYGVFFFALLVLLTVGVNMFITVYYKEREYQLKFAETEMKL